MEQNKKYLVSVVTPFHNVDMKYFSECVASMRRQTIGFENVQWIIVVHNCEPKYLSMLKEMFANDSNVVLEELNDEHRTPSSPRNRGLELVEAPYIGLLDGDDYYSDDCFEVVLKEIEETKSDMIYVRRESVKGSDNVNMFNATSIFNNTERRTIMEYGHWDTEKMLYGTWGMSTSYFYSSKMLNENSICFDNEVLCAEDVLFVLHCIAHSNRVTYLNQYIGYKYVINDSSIVQNVVKPANTVVQYARGYKTIIDAVIKYGIDYNMIAFTFNYSLLGNILYCQDLTTEQRYEIKDLLGKYLISLKLNTRYPLISEEEDANALRLIREIILNPEKSIMSLAVDELSGFITLKKILQNNNDTDIAVRNDFHSITTLDAWQFRMPQTDAVFYKPLINLQYRVGQKKLLTTAPSIIYLRTDTGILLPCTGEHLGHYHEAVNSILNNHNNLLLSTSKPILGMTNDTAVIDTLYSALVKSYFKYHYLENGIMTTYFASSMSTYFPQCDADYRNLVLDALAKTDMDQLVAFTCEEVVTFFHYIEENWRDLVNEVKCSDERRNELQTILSTGFDAVATKLWPNLQRSVAFGSGEHYEAFQQMKRYTGDLPHNHGYYFTEEAILGKAVADDSNLFECIKGVNFYELKPLATEDAPVFWTQVEMGKPYQLIVTNRAGLYRYTTDHFICPQKVSITTIEFTIY